MPISSPTSSAALVTGAASGIGRHVATVLAARGMTVAALDIDHDRLSALHRTQPDRITPFRCDVSDEDAVRRTVRAVADLGPLRKVVHCAGIASLAPLLDQPTADIDRMVQVNYLGTVHLTRATVPLLAGNGGGELTVLASIAGWIPLTDVGAYSATKAAVIAYCEVLAAECRPLNIRVVCVCPSGVETPMLESFRRTHPHTVGNVPGMPPHAVHSAAERALARGRLFAFPGRGTATAWRARRLSPTGLTRLLDAVIKRQAGRR